MDNRIKVGVRVRPLSTKETQDGSTSTVITDSNGRILIGADQKKQQFQFDWSFQTSSEQRQIYDTMCKPLIDKFFEGYNATFFACKLHLIHFIFYNHHHAYFS